MQTDSVDRNYADAHQWPREKDEPRKTRKRERLGARLGGQHQRQLIVEEKGLGHAREAEEKPRFRPSPFQGGQRQWPTKSGQHWDLVLRHQGLVVRSVVPAREPLRLQHEAERD